MQVDHGVVDVVVLELAARRDHHEPAVAAEHATRLAERRAGVADEVQHPARDARCRARRRGPAARATSLRTTVGAEPRAGVAEHLPGEVGAEHGASEPVAERPRDRAGADADLEDRSRTAVRLDRGREPDAPLEPAARGVVDRGHLVERDRLPDGHACHHGRMDDERTDDLVCAAYPAFGDAGGDALRRDRELRGRRHPARAHGHLPVELEPRRGRERGPRRRPAPRRAHRAHERPVGGTAHAHGADRPARRVRARRSTRSAARARTPCRRRSRPEVRPAGPRSPGALAGVDRRGRYHRAFGTQMPSWRGAGPSCRRFGVRPRGGQLRAGPAELPARLRRLVRRAPRHRSGSARARPRRRHRQVHPPARAARCRPRRRGARRRDAGDPAHDESRCARCSPAPPSSSRSGSATLDAITVAQAFHWFDAAGRARGGGAGRCDPAVGSGSCGTHGTAAVRTSTRCGRSWTASRRRRRGARTRSGARPRSPRRPTSGRCTRRRSTTRRS